MIDHTLKLLGLARRGGRLALGEEPVVQACQSGQAKAVLLAADAGDSTARRGARLAERNGVSLLRLPYTKAELGSETGRTSCALAALTDVGLAAAVAQRLAEGDETLRPAAKALEEKAQRRKDRRGGKEKGLRAERKPADR